MATLASSGRTTMHQSDMQAQVLAMGHTIHRVTALCPAALVWKPGSQPERLTADTSCPTPCPSRGGGGGGTWSTKKILLWLTVLLCG